MRYRSLSPLFVVGCMLGSAVAAGCHPSEPESPDVGLRRPVDPPKFPYEGRYPPTVEIERTYNVWLADTHETCKGPAPFFGFDSSKPESEDQPTMQTLATCMNDGALKGKSIRLIGHTDPRGTPNYNEKLGFERADRVKRYLTAHNVDPARVSVESAGEDDASKYPADWPKDRRVEVRMAK